jgi:hypothetical protein
MVAAVPLNAMFMAEDKVEGPEDFKSFLVRKGTTPDAYFSHMANGFSVVAEKATGC